MNSREYLLRALNAGCYKDRAWVFTAFSVVRNSTLENKPFEIDNGLGQYTFYNPETEVMEIIEDSDTKAPLFGFKDVINLKPGDVQNLKVAATVTVGQLLVNMISLVFPLGDKIDFVTGEFDIKVIERIVASRLTTNVKYQDKNSRVVDNPIFVDEYLLFIDSTLALEGFSQLCVPSASPKALTTDPNIPKRRKELLTQYKDQLDDPTVIAKIEEELVAMDRAWIKGDISEGFYHLEKHYKTARKKMHVMHGLERGFGQEPELVDGSLSEGWDTEKLPAMVNSLREASYARGKGTGLGGYATKIVNRMFQNVDIDGDDCGSKLGWDVDITQANLVKYIGFYRIKSNGDPELIDEKNGPSFIGKSIIKRSPQFCKGPDGKFCRVCMGTPNTESPHALAAYTSAITSTLMNLEMKKMHSNTLSTTLYDITSSIS